MIRLLLLVVALLLPLEASASWHWVTAAKIGSGTEEDPVRVALGEARAITTGRVMAVDGTDYALVLVSIDDGAGYTQRLAKVKAVGTYLGREKCVDGQRVIGATLRKRLMAEAAKLGAVPEWAPEKFTIGVPCK